MTFIKEYIMRMIVACLLCGIITTVSSRFRSTHTIIRSLCGVLLAVTFFSPILQLRWDHALQFWDNYNNNVSYVASQGTDVLSNGMREGIQQRTESYILDKATQYGCQLQVHVEVSEDNPPLPMAVKLEGNIAPYYKAQLSNMIAQDLGIPKEQQTWNARNG